MLSKDKILSVLKNNKPALQNLGVEEIGLFGSYAKTKQEKKAILIFLQSLTKPTTGLY